MKYDLGSNNAGLRHFSWEPLFTLLLVLHSKKKRTFTVVSQSQTILRNLLLFGVTSLPYTDNVIIFEKSPKVHKRHKMILTAEAVWNKMFCTCNSLFKSGLTARYFPLICYCQSPFNDLR